MWRRLKTMPMFVKIMLGSLLVLFVYVTTRPEPRPLGQNEVSPGASRDGGSLAQNARGGDRTASEEEKRDQLLQQLEAQDQQLIGTFQQCQAEVVRQQNQTAAMLMNGGTSMMGELPCQRQMEQIAAQVAFVETEIYRLKSGDWRSTLFQIQGIPQPASSSGTASSSDRRFTPSDDGTDAVDNWDRGAIRGTSLYRDENGEERELPTARYYYHNLETGQYVPSESPNPPNDGHDYQRMTPQN